MFRSDFWVGVRPAKPYLGSTGRHTRLIWPDNQATNQTTNQSTDQTKPNGQTIDISVCNEFLCYASSKSSVIYATVKIFPYFQKLERRLIAQISRTRAPGTARVRSALTFGYDSAPSSSVSSAVHKRVTFEQWVAWSKLDHVRIT